jgi:hypothetical protein
VIYGASRTFVFFLVLLSPVVSEFADAGAEDVGSSGVYGPWESTDSPSTVLVWEDINLLANRLESLITLMEKPASLGREGITMASVGAEINTADTILQNKVAEIVLGLYNSISPPVVSSRCAGCKLISNVFPWCQNKPSI